MSFEPPPALSSPGGPPLPPPLTSSGEASRMRASWPSFLCEPLKRVAELSRSWSWLPSDPDPPEACVEGGEGEGGPRGGSARGRGRRAAEAVAGARARRA